MVVLTNDALLFRFPEVHPQASLTVSLERTFRVPEDGGTYTKPKALGRFPLRLVDDFPRNTPPLWKEHGGVMLPIYRSEALWVSLIPGMEYPFAVKVAAGKINAVNGGPWREDFDLPQQDYLVSPGQESLDGFVASDGRIRQFTAEFLGQGATREERVTGAARYGGLQIAVWPLKADAFQRWAGRGGARRRVAEPTAAFAADMGLTDGGKIIQPLITDPFGPDEWETDLKQRCFVHLCDAWLWEHMTGEAPPSRPPRPEEYRAQGLPWVPQLYEEPQPEERLGRPGPSTTLH